MTDPRAATVRYREANGPARRVVFEPRDDDSWLRSEQTWTGCRWRTTGREVVESVRVVPPTVVGETRAGP